MPTTADPPPADAGLPAPEPCSWYCDRCQVKIWTGYRVHDCDTPHDHYGRLLCRRCAERRRDALASYGGCG